MVPFGPKLDFMTSCNPFAALMFMNRAAALDMISALGFTDFKELEAMVVVVSVSRLQGRCANPTNAPRERREKKKKKLRLALPSARSPLLLVRCVLGGKIMGRRKIL
jgi:hypothetical protein